MNLNLEQLLALVGIVLPLCIVLSKLSSKIGIPTLLLFILLGISFTHPNLLDITFDDFKLSSTLTSFALIFIMFYGGFGTRWEEAKSVAKEAIVLSSLGVFATALLLTVLCNLILGIPLKESFLIGAVISSTDAASVFAIIRFRKLSLKFGTSSLLELESGSNDPFSYMLTVIAVSLFTGSLSPQGTLITILSQIIIGVASGFIFFKLTMVIVETLNLDEGFEAVFIFSAAILAYAVPTLINGNGYLSTYILGICLGNSKISNKKPLLHFFDGITNLSQMLLFFLLGLLSTPSKIIENLPRALIVFLLLTFIVRPIAVELLLIPFGSKRNQKHVISFSGLRGAASIVFAIMATNSISNATIDVFHITFGIVLFSILIQGSLLPVVAKKLKMTDPLNDALKTFTDYSEEKPIEFITLTIDENHPWASRKLSSIVTPRDLLLVLVRRENETFVPEGDTVLKPDDKIVCIARTFLEGSKIELKEITIDENSKYLNSPLSDLKGEKKLVVLIKRGEEHIIPSGSDKLLNGDEIIFIEEEMLH